MRGDPRVCAMAGSTGDEPLRSDRRNRLPPILRGTPLLTQIARIEVNLQAAAFESSDVMRITRAALPHLRRSRAAAIVNVGSVVADSVNPGTVDTSAAGHIIDNSADPAATRAALVARQPTGRLVSADEVGTQQCSTRRDIVVGGKSVERRSRQAQRESGTGIFRQILFHIGQRCSSRSGCLCQGQPVLAVSERASLGGDGLCRNLSDKVTKTSASVFTTAVGAPIGGSVSDPRTFGVRLGYRF